MELCGMLADDSFQSMGGKARAEALSDERRVVIARKAAEARWAIPVETHEGELDIGGIKILCHVLSDGTRLVSQEGMNRGLGRRGRPKAKHGENRGLQLPVFLQANNLQTFIPQDNVDVFKPIRFKRRSGGAYSVGYKAEILPKTCHIFLDAKEARKLVQSQFATAARCKILARGFSEVGIIALVDEATGYQYDRARNALAQILEHFISKELQAWTKTFPLEFYQELFRLKNWPFNPKTMQGPRAIAQYTNDIIYRRLAPGVLDELRAKNPVIQGRRKHKHFQWLTGDVGHPKLLAHLEGVKILMKESDTWQQFQAKLDKYYPIIETTELGLVLPHMPKPKANRLDAYNELMASLAPAR